MLAKAPTLAWLLTALACFLAGMAMAQGRDQGVALPALPPVAVVVTVEVAHPAAAPEPSPTPVPTLDPWTPLDRVPTLACDPAVGRTPRSG